MSWYNLETYLQAYCKVYKIKTDCCNIFPTLSFLSYHPHINLMPEFPEVVRKCLFSFSALFQDYLTTERYKVNVH